MFSCLPAYVIQCLSSSYVDAHFRTMLYSICIYGGATFPSSHYYHCFFCLAIFCGIYTACLAYVCTDARDTFYRGAAPSRGPTTFYHAPRSVPYIRYTTPIPLPAPLTYTPPLHTLPTALPRPAPPRLPHHPTRRTLPLRYALTHAAFVCYGLRWLRACCYISGRCVLWMDVLICTLSRRSPQPTTAILSSIPRRAAARSSLSTGCFTDSMARWRSRDRRGRTMRYRDVPAGAGSPRLPRHLQLTRTRGGTLFS